MQSLNDDMDDLFRQAAKDYPLKTDSDNWDSVLNKMEAPVKPILPPARKRYNKMFWLLLLIPFAWVCNNYFVDHEDIISDSLQYPISHPSNNNEIKINKPDIIADKAFSYKPHSSLHLSQKLTNKPGFDKSVIKFKDKYSQRRVEIIRNDDNETLMSRYDFVSAKALELFLQTPDLLPFIKTIQVDNILLQKQILINDSTIHKLFSKENGQSRPKKFYTGIIAGTDISTVKMQKITHTGFNLGIIAGYHFSKRFSLQTGLVFNKKNYYSAGSYFSTKHLNTPPNYYIKTVDGSCQMYEVPLLVTYKLSSKHNKGLLLNAGLSSYLMRGEKYNYFVVHDGYAYTKNASYTNRSLNVMAAAIGGITLRNNFAKGATLNVEPYFKIPLRGVGLGKLPVTSAGMNISITKDLF